ncbi:MAG: MmgE/PrpD family protein [Pseudomonadota bacterium]
MPDVIAANPRPPITRRLAEWAHAVPAVEDPQVLRQAADGLADTVACMVAGAGDEAAARLRTGLERYGSGPAVVVGSHARMAAPWAAMANGMAAHVLDFDDNYGPGFTHASAVIVPALLALADGRTVSGKAWLDAYVIGLELQAVIGRGMGRTQYDLGWHSTSTVGCLGAAGAAARLLGLDADGIANAISLAVSLASGAKVQFGSPGKPFHAGMAAHNAVLAAELAAAGMTARDDAIEGERGFIDLYAGDGDTGWEALLAELGTPEALLRFGLLPKLYPCCGSTHKVLDGVLALRETHGFGAADVAAVDTLVGYGNVRNLCYPDPRQEMEARFSMNYCVAVALHAGRVSLSDFTPQAVMRPEVRDLLGLTTMRSYPADAEGSDSLKRLPHEVRITLRDGRELHESVATPRGAINVPFTEADKRAKFDDCCASQLSAEALTTLRAQLESPERMADTAALTACLEFGAGADRGERFQRAA